MPATASITTAVPDSPAAAQAIASSLAATVDRVAGGPLARAAAQLQPPVERYQASGVIAGLLAADTITTLDGETFPATMAPPLRRWAEKNPAAAARPSRWIVYPRTIAGGLAFYVVGQRQPLPAETDAQLNREVDRFTITGVITNSRGLRRQTCVRICRNTPAPRGLKKHPSWRPRFLFLAGLPPAPTKSWWNTDARIQCRREGRALRILAIEKVGPAAVARPIPIGPAELPWPWRPSSQAIWRLCHRDSLAGVMPWPCSDADADLILKRYLAVSTVVLTELAPVALARQADRIDPAKRAELTAMAQHHMDLLRQWLASTNRWLAGLPPAEQQGLADAHQLKQRLAMAAVADLEGVLEIDGERFWFEGWPVRGRAARILRENLPLAPTGTLKPIEAQEAPPVPAKAKKAPTRSRKKPPSSVEAIVEELTAEAKAKGWSEHLLYMRITRAIDAFLS